MKKNAKKNYQFGVKNQNGEMSDKKFMRLTNKMSFDEFNEFVKNHPETAKKLQRKVDHLSGF